MKYLSREGDMVDALAFKHYGKHSDEVLNLIFEANPGLGLYEELPPGLIIELPPIPLPVEEEEVKLFS